LASVQTGPAYKIVRLPNGVFSVHSLAHRETFHPVIGPVAEADALYVRQLRICERLAQLRDEFVIWDVGLGAAANALTVLRATSGFTSSIHLVSFDHTLEPLRFALRHAEQLGYFRGYEEPIDRLAQGEKQVEFRNEKQTVAWDFHLGDFPTLLRQSSARAWPKPHAIMFDAYSPAKNPAMWTQRLFADLFGLLDPDQPCALPTYSRSTMLRVTLLLAGFYVGHGHATGEKEETTIAANTPGLISEPLGKRWLQRARNSTSAEPLWEPHYVQAPLSAEAWRKLESHPQFRPNGPFAVAPSKRA
jgi:tRNA U34 5-methylaminomethyl-2-thiouridine-forming methyltransferase MnmC